MLSYARMEQVLVTNLIRLNNLIAIVCLWKIFTANKEEGWKALIPFYSDFIFGKIINEPKQAKKYIFDKVLFLISAFLLVGFIAHSIALGSNGQLYTDENIMNITASGIDKMSAGGLMLGMVSLIGIVSFFCKAFVDWVVLKYRFLQFKDIERRWIIPWIFIPFVAWIYVAFYWRKKNENIN